jgi:hypothetical protein
VLGNTVVGKTNKYDVLGVRGLHSTSSKPKFPVSLLNTKIYVRILDLNMSIKVCHKNCKLIYHVGSAGHGSEY